MKRRYVTEFCFNEKYNNTNDSISNLESKSLEMDADAFAACSLLREIMELKNNNEIFDVLKNREDLYKLYALAIQGTFILLENELEENNTHPPANIRACLCVDGASNLFSKLGHSKELFLDITVTEMANLYRINAVINNIDDKIFIQNITSQTKVAAAIMKYWYEYLEQKLLPFKWK